MNKSSTSRNSKTISGLLAGKGKQENVYSDLLPAVDNFYELGSNIKKWKSIYSYSGFFEEQLNVSGPLNSGNTVISGTLTVTGIITSSNLNVNGPLTVTGLLTSSNLAATGTLTVTGETTINNNLYVSGRIAVNDNLIANKSCQVSGDVITAGDLSVTGKLFCASDAVFLGNLNTFIYKVDNTGDGSTYTGRYKLYIKDSQLFLGYYRGNLLYSRTAIINVPT
jgi:cytoskeletal protein CcmA (bactofilin family)